MSKDHASPDSLEVPPSGAGEAASLLDQVLDDRPVAAPDGLRQVLSGHLRGIDDEGRVLFAPEDGSGAVHPVAIGLPISDGALVRAARREQRALVLRTGDRTPRLVLVGLVRDRVAARARDARPGQLQVEVDGETLQLSAERQIELRCGKASLLLRRDGKVVLSGTSILSASQGPHRLRGATISLN